MAASVYSPPLEELEFCLKEVGGLRDILKFESYDSFSEDLIFAILEEAAKFSTSVLSPLNSAGDIQGCNFNDGRVTMPEGFKDAYRLFVDNGWNAISVATEHGGQGLPAILATAIAEMWHGANMAFSLCPLLTQGAIELLVRHGSLELQQKFLPSMVTGEWSGTMCMTEAHAGSDIGLISSTATAAGDHYLIKGTKIFITYGEHDMAENIIHMVLARLPGAAKGVKGLSLFLVPKFLVGDDGELQQRNDVSCVSIEHKMGIHASPTAVLSFGDTGDGAIGYLIGEEHGGIKAMFTMMNSARLAVGIEGIGLAGYASQLAHAYAAERVQGRDVSGNMVTIDKHTAVKRDLLRMDAHISGLRALAIYTARHMDISRHHPNADLRLKAQQRLDLLIPVVKAHSTERAFEIISRALQIHGGAGYIEETGLSQLLRDSRIAMIYEGTNEIQALDLVLRKALMDDGDVLKEFISEIQDAALSFGELDSTEMTEISATLSEAAKQLDIATLWLLQQHGAARSEVTKLHAIHYVAETYLQLLGTVVQGYLLAAGAYKTLASSGDYSAEFSSRKLRLAHFFALDILPQTHDLCRHALRGDAALGTRDHVSTTG